MIVPAGTVTFIIWAIYTVVRKATGQPAQERPGVLKWVFIVVLLAVFVAHLVLDHVLAPRAALPPWYLRLRRLLTAGVVLCLLAALVR